MTFKLFLASDIHGSNKCYKKFLNAAKFYGAQVLVLCGDIAGKALIFILKRPDGTYWCNNLGREVVLNSEEQLLALRKEIDDSGYYSYVCDLSEYNTFARDIQKQDSLLMDLIYQRMKEWIELAEVRLQGSDVEVYILPGNDDPPRIDELFERCKKVINPEGKVLKIKEDHEMIASGYVNMTPWKAPRDIEEGELLKKLESMAAKLEHPERSIFALHAPPIGTNLDLAPKLDETFKPKTVMGQIELTHVGSSSVRKVIQVYQPLLSLHGHVHESKAVHKIGRTLCVNAGSEYENGILKGALISLAKNKVENYYLTAG